MQMLTAFHFSIFYKRSIIFSGGFTFQKLPDPSPSITVMRKLLSHILVTHVFMYRI